MVHTQAFFSFLNNAEQLSNQCIFGRSGIAHSVERMACLISHYELPVLSPANASQVCGRDRSAAMLAAKRSAGVAPEMNLRECVTHMLLPSLNKAAPLALKPRGDVTRSPKQGYQWSHKKDSCPPKIFKKINAYLRHIHANISKCDVKEINQIRACISLAFPYPLLD